MIARLVYPEESDSIKKCIGRNSFYLELSGSEGTTLTYPIFIERGEKDGVAHLRGVPFPLQRGVFSNPRERDVSN